MQKVLIRCIFCGTDNFEEGKCQRCGKDLLPSRTPKERLKDFLIGFGITFLITTVATIMGRYGISRYGISEPLSNKQAIILFIVGFFISLAVALWIALRKDSESEKFKRRAKYHLSISPERALLDFTKAAETTKDLDERFNILKEKIRLLEALGKEKERQDCLLSYLYMIEKEIQTKGNKVDASLFMKRAETLELLHRIQEALSDYERVVAMGTPSLTKATKSNDAAMAREAKKRINKLRERSSLTEQ